MATGQDNSAFSSDINEVLNSLGQMIDELDTCGKEVDKIKSMGIYQDADLSLEALLADTDDFDGNDQLCLITQGSQLQSFTPSTGNCSSQQNCCLESVDGKGTSGYHTASLTPSQTGRCTPLQKAPSKLNGVYTGQHCKEDAVKKNGFHTEVHGSFKKTVNESAAKATSCTKMHTPSSPVKAQPNYYVSPSEMSCQTTSNKTTHLDGSEKGEFAEGHNMSRNTCTHQRKKEELGSITQIPVKVYSDDHEPVMLLITANTSAREACHKLVLLNKFEDDPLWVLVEHLTDLGLERNLEDHEVVWSVIKTWAPGSNNKLLLRKDHTKYHFFTHTSNYFPPHLLDSELSDKAVTEQAQKAKTILHQKLFSTCARVPEIEGYLHFKDFSKKSWSKKFFFLRGSGLYCSTKGKSKASRDLECHVQFDGANLYNILNPKKLHKAPTEFSFCIVPFKAKELKDLKCLCADDEKAVNSWRVAVRIAKYGPQLRQNYDGMMRKFVKLIKYQESGCNQQKVMNETEERTMETLVKEGQVAMDFTGDRGKLITDSKEIQQLAFTRHKVKITRRISSPNFIPTHTVTPGCQFKHEPWYHEQITRERSLELLMAAGLMDGLFLVRESSSVPGVFVLSFCMNMRVYHCQLVEDIGQGNETFFSLGRGQAFRTLQELISFYQKKPLNGVSLALRTPCPKEDRPLTSPRS